MEKQEFREQADTGDILLFTGTSFTCKIQRMITRSRFGKKILLNSLTNL